MNSITTKNTLVVVGGVVAAAVIIIIFVFFVLFLRTIMNVTIPIFIIIIDIFDIVSLTTSPKTFRYLKWRNPHLYKLYGYGLCKGKPIPNIAV